MLETETREELIESLPAILTIKDASEFLRCSDMTIRRMIWDKQITAFMVDGEWNITRADFIGYLSRHSSL